MKCKRLLILIGISFLIACLKNNNPYNIYCSTSKSVATDVLLVKQFHCSSDSSCHATGSSKGPDALLTYSGIYSCRSSIRNSVVNGTKLMAICLKASVCQLLSSMLPSVGSMQVLWITDGAEYPFSFRYKNRKQVCFY